MFFGATSFASAPFASEYIQNSSVLLTGNRLNITIGNATVAIVEVVSVTGNRFNLASDPVSVVSWNPIPPGVSQIWIPIDPNNP